MTPRSPWAFRTRQDAKGALLLVVLRPCRLTDVARRILRVLMAKLRLSGDFDYHFLAKSTPGYVGADLSALTGAAGVIAVKRIFEQIRKSVV